MKNITPMFPGFHIQTLRRKPRSAQQKLAEKLALLRQKSFKQIGEVFEKFIPGYTVTDSGRVHGGAVEVQSAQKSWEFRLDEQ